MAINRAQVGRMTLMTAALVLLPLRCDRLGALSRFLCGLASGMIPSFAGLKKRRTFNVAAVFAVLLGSLAAGVFGGVVVWALCEFDHELRYGLTSSGG